MCALARPSAVPVLISIPYVLCFSDRPLDAREKPALIQRRRLIQAGFNENDRIEELGMEDLSLLCAFIYRMPKLPSVDSVSRNAFFSTLQLSGADLALFPFL